MDRRQQREAEREMTLTKADRDWIRNTIREELAAAVREQEARTPGTPAFYARREEERQRYSPPYREQAGAPEQAAYLPAAVRP